MFCFVLSFFLLPNSKQNLKVWDTDQINFDWLEEQLE